MPTPDLPNSASGGGYISRTLRIEGVVSGEGDLYVDGELAGEIRLEGRRVTVGEPGRVDADVRAGEIRVMGALAGSAQAEERVEVAQTGSVRGEVTTRRIKIEEGAHFEGSVKISGTNKAAERTAEKRPPAAATSGAPKVVAKAG